MESKPTIIILSVFVFIILGNILILDIWLIKQNGNKKNEQTPQATMVPEKITAQTDSQPMCTQACMEIIREATSSLTLKTSEPTSKPRTTTQTQVTSSVKEFFIPFGSGTSNSTDWQDVAGMQAYVDTGNYGKIKSTTFEATIRVPTANQTTDLRVFNATDKHPVWFSDIHFMQSDTAIYIASPNIVLDAGNKLYQVQIKTQLGAISNIEQARLRILTY